MTLRNARRNAAERVMRTIVRASVRHVSPPRRYVLIITSGVAHMYRQLVPADDKPEIIPKKPRRRATREWVLEDFMNIPVDIMEMVITIPQ